MPGARRTRPRMFHVKHSFAVAMAKADQPIFMKPSEYETIQNAMPGFAALAEEFGLKG